MDVGEASIPQPPRSIFKDHIASILSRGIQYSLLAQLFSLYSKVMLHPEREKNH